MFFLLNSCGLIRAILRGNGYICRDFYIYMKINDKRNEFTDVTMDMFNLEMASSSLANLRVPD